MIDIDEMFPLGQYEVTALYKNHPIEYDFVDTAREAEIVKRSMLKEHGDSIDVYIVNKVQ